VNKPLTKDQATERNLNANRPKKRRKIAEDDSDVETGENDYLLRYHGCLQETMETGNPAPADVVNPNSEEQQHPNINRSPTPLATLPSFPLPALPNAPPKSVFALQGLDQALVDAEIVDPSTLLPIPLDADNDAGTGLTEKMRRRLKELGITELFAGLNIYISRD
jgi:ATP-dependent RNA helicase DDX51/DBP6